MKFRKATKHFLEDRDGKKFCCSYYAIESLVGKHWNLLADDKGILKFQTEEERDKVLEQYKKEFGEI